MITKSSLPNGFRPYDIINICSNRLLGGSYILSFGEVLPVLLGRGSKPLIWIQALSDVKEAAFLQVVEESIPLFPTVRVEAEKDSLLVTVSNSRVLVVRQIDEKTIEIPEIDLRPVGFNLHGDRNKLNAGGLEFSNNTFSGGGTFIGFSL